MPNLREESNFMFPLSGIFTDSHKVVVQTPPRQEGLYGNRHIDLFEKDCQCHFKFDIASQMWTKSPNYKL